MAPQLVTGSDTAAPVNAGVGGDLIQPEGRLVARIYGAVLGGLLLGYMFMGRGFAHIGIGPIFIGDVVLLLGIVAAAVVLMRSRTWPPVTWTVAFIVAFAALGAARTLPFWPTYGMAALRDGALWGYAAFALIVYVIADRRFLLAAFRAYGWIVPVFALWLPISWNLFRTLSADIDPNRPAEFVPLIFFKGGDMAIHAVGAIAFLVLGAPPIRSALTFIFRTVICLPLLWTMFVAGTSNRGGLITAILGILAIVVLAPRSKNWLPFVAAIGLGVAALLLQAAVGAAGGGPSAAATAPGEAGAGNATAPASAAPRASAGATSVDGVLAIVASDAPSPHDGDPLRILNPGFEAGALRSGGIDQWKPFGSGTYNIVEGRAHGGDNFAWVDNTADAYQATLTSSQFAVRAGEDIAVRVWVKAITGRPVLEIYVTWFAADGAMLSSDFAGELRTGGSSRWQEGVGVQSVPDGATHAAILFYEATGGAALGIDDVTARSGDFITVDPGSASTLPRRPATLQQVIDNLLSLFVQSDDPGLEGTKQFRLAWWGTIIDYTVFGEHFWTGKGFGVNLADDDGFQTTADGSLRAPHNSHLTVLARMGVPGIALWLAILIAFAIGVVRTTLAYRRAGEVALAALGGWILVYWFAMMVNTSFDPYLEGPQGGIWLWALSGFGLAFTRMGSRGSESG